MKTTIYLIRHGYSVANEQDIFAGHTDADLTEKGLLQAEAAAAYLEKIPVDHIYSSDLTRAYRTAQATAKRHNLPVIPNQNLREIYGGAWEGMAYARIPDSYPQEFALWKNNVGLAHCPQGESTLQLQERMVTEIRKLAEENKGKTIFLFSHACAIRLFRAYCDGATPQEIQAVPWASNASVSQVDYEDGQFHLISYSVDHYLKDLVTFLPAGV